VIDSATCLSLKFFDPLGRFSFGQVQIDFFTCFIRQRL
jgi:hypothetical protein